ncbi:MAG: acetyl-CoA acetyltransferase [Nocardioidaceae bacterium]
MSRQPAIVGVSESDLGVTGLDALTLLGQAVLGALADAGLTMSDVDGLAVNGVSRFSTAQVAEHLGIQPSWTDSTAAGGASYELFVGHAADAVRAGRAEVVVVAYGSDQRSSGSRTVGGVQDESSPQFQFEVPYGPLFPISLYAMAAQRYLHEYQAEMAQLAEVAVAAREWARLNPVAYRYDAGGLTADDVVASPPISSPLRALDCCLVTDGGGAVVVTTLERARDLKRQPVVVLGHGERTTSTSMSGVPDLLRTGAAGSAETAFAMAGLTPADVDVAQVYDSFTITVLLSLEALGFCEYGEATSFIADGRTRPGGAFPLNTSGGGLSYTHPGMFGIFLLIEAVRQLRGECGPRQVPSPEIAVAHGTGYLLSTHGTVLLGVDR